jgi:hypothetical protein
MPKPVVYILDPSYPDKKIAVGGWEYKQLVRKIGSLQAGAIPRQTSTTLGSYAYDPGPMVYANVQGQLTDVPPNEKLIVKPVQLSRREKVRQELEKRLTWSAQMQREIAVEREKLAVQVRHQGSEDAAQAARKVGMEKVIAQLKVQESELKGTSEKLREASLGFHTRMHAKQTEFDKKMTDYHIERDTSREQARAVTESQAAGARELAEAQDQNVKRLAEEDKERAAAAEANKEAQSKIQRDSLNLGLRQLGLTSKYKKYTETEKTRYDNLVKNLKATTDKEEEKRNSAAHATSLRLQSEALEARDKTAADLKTESSTALEALMKDLREQKSDQAEVDVAHNAEQKRQATLQDEDFEQKKRDLEISNAAIQRTLTSREKQASVLQKGTLAINKGIRRELQRQKVITRDMTTLLTSAQEQVQAWLAASSKK